MTIQIESTITLKMLRDAVDRVATKRAEATAQAIFVRELEEALEEKFGVMMANNQIAGGSEDKRKADFTSKSTADRAQIRQAKALLQQKRDALANAEDDFACLKLAGSWQGPRE